MERILIARMSALGDIVHSLPAVAALRRAFPQARIGWIVEERWAPLLTARSNGGARQAANDAAAARGADQPLVDVVHRLDSRAWRASPLAPRTRAQIKSLAAELRSERYELAVDLQAAIRSAFVNWMSRAPERVGFRSPRESLAKIFYTRTAPTPATHVVDQGLQLAQAIDAGAGMEAEFPLPQDEPAERWREAQLHTMNMAARDFAMVAPAAGWGAKIWPAERYAKIAAALAEYGLQVLVNAGPGEREMAAQVESLSASGDRVRAMECSLGQLIALIRRARMVVGGDTGPVHLAAACGIPVLAIYGPTDPARNGPYAPGGSKQKVTVLRSPASRTSHARLAKTEEGLLHMAAEEAVEAALHLLRRTQ